MSCSVLCWIGVAVCGAAGAASRYAVETVFRSCELQGNFWPIPTLLVNILGSAFAAAISVLAGTHFPLTWRAPLLAGFAGSFTTFSRMSLEAHQCIIAGKPLQGAAHLILGPVAGLLSVAVTVWALTVLMDATGNLP